MAEKSSHLFRPFTLCFANGQKQVFTKPAVMGVLNQSPDSFFNPLPDVSSALRAAETMVQAGADFLDVGGEATNPDVSALVPNIQGEIDRVVPVIEAIKQRFSVRVSVDTRFAAVMQASIEAGVDLINDQSCLQDPRATELIIKRQIPICLMHGLFPKREPGSSSQEGLLAAVITDLKKVAQNLMSRGLAHSKIILDPGFGGGHYGKSTAENFYLLAHLSELASLTFPVLVGLSRKSMIGDVLNAKPEDRLYGSLAALLRAAEQGASIFRVHDVKASVEALKVWFF